MQPFDAIASMIAGQPESALISNTPLPKVAPSSLESALIYTEEATDLVLSPVMVNSSLCTNGDADSDVSTVRDAHGVGNVSQHITNNEPVTDGQMQTMSDSPSPTAQTGADASTSSSTAQGDVRNLEAYGLAIGRAFSNSTSPVQPDFSAEMANYDASYQLGSGELGSLDDYFALELFNELDSTSENMLGQAWPENVSGMDDVRF
jgi:hypothetical protein